MPNRRTFLNTMAVIGAAGVLKTPAATNQTAISRSDDRTFWLNTLIRLSEPVLSNLSQGRLKEKMPVETLPGFEAERREFSHLEALGRLLSGIAPWLELDTLTAEESRIKSKIANLARQSMASATNPQSRDFMNFSSGRQPVVDAAFLALAIIRAPTELWKKLDAKTQADTIAALKSTRTILPSFNNWLLFTATIEAALCLIGEQWNKVSVDYAIRQHEQWYKGDSIYGDGPEFHYDYYNSYVIHPMLLTVLEITQKAWKEYEAFYQRALVRSRRYAEILERLISPEGTFPAIGRSITYRFGAFQLLGQIALMRQLPSNIAPAQVRCALTSVIKRMIEAPGTFDKNGWLTPGFSGHQPKLAESYVSTGSLYLCANGLLPLGLPATDEFWNSPAQDWTSKRLWSGENLNADHRLLS
jgi:hypothetical protein